ncbi:hypothetical protein ACJX0J_028291, partial [Zea mays]
YMLSTFLGKPFTYFIGYLPFFYEANLSKTKNFLLDELGETNTKTQYARSSITHILFIEGDNWRYPNSNGLTASSSLCTVLIGTFCLYNKNMINLFKVNVHYSSFLSVSLKNILIQCLFAFIKNVFKNHSILYTIDIFQYCYNKYKVIVVAEDWTMK